jgi:cyclopropane-fatty-acyl-phospholipid synthase
MRDRERIAAAYRALLERAPAANLPALALVFPDGERLHVGLPGGAPPAFSLVARDSRGHEAIASLDALTLAEAFMEEHLDVEGDLLAATRYAEVLGDVHPWIMVWRRLQPILLGRERLNPAWIALHYDSANAQLFAADRDYDTYTPGEYFSDDDTLETGAERKLAIAFDHLGLRSGDHLLDVGCGWGGMLRYAARRGVRVTGITLSKDQFGYVRKLIDREKLDADVRYQDFFTFEPGRRFDGVSMMGVIEDLSDYRRTLRALERLLAPGGRVYLDFAASRTRFGTHTFVTRYVWPGTFRMVFMPELMEAIRESPFELEWLKSDRHNYFVWCRRLLERWTENRAPVEAQYGARTWRTFALLLAGSSAMMDYRSHAVTAFRVVLELPADSDRAFVTSPARRVADQLLAAGAATRDAVASMWQRLTGHTVAQAVEVAPSEDPARRVAGDYSNGAGAGSHAGRPAHRSTDARSGTDPD